MTHLGSDLTCAMTWLEPAASRPRTAASSPLHGAYPRGAAAMPRGWPPEPQPR